MCTNTHLNTLRNSSVYKQIYNFEIIEAVMNEGDSNGEAGEGRVFYVCC
jgi:hypothetical protein